MSEAKPTYEQLEALVAVLQKQNAQLKARLDELEERLAKNSTNSSKPPSSDSPRDRAQRRDRKRRNRKRGAQKGHKGHHRKPFDLDRVDHFQTIFPTHCRCCNHQLDPSTNTRNGRTHQVADLDPDRGGMVVTQYQTVKVRCSQCGKWTAALLPEDLRWSLGPRMAALVCVLTGRFHLSKERVCELLAYVFKLHISPGTVSNIEHQTSQALAPAHAQALEAVQNQTNGRHGDETSWPQRFAGRYGWLWLLATRLLAVFCVHDRRDKAAAAHMVGDGGEHATVTDRFGSWLAVLGERNQYCWAHLMRDFEAMAESSDEQAGKVGHKLVMQAKRMFAIWQQSRDGPQSHEEMVQRLEGVQKEVQRLLEVGQKCGHKKYSGMCRRLLQQEDHLWVFLEVEGLAPDNNHAERLLRQAVLWRRRSGGTDSPRGSAFVERILTSIETLRLQGRCALDFLDRTIAAYRSGLPFPSLLPA